jgi:Arc/MetJ family transcription regulator
MLLSYEPRHTHLIRRTSLNLDLDLVAEARDVLRTSTTTETIHRALEEVVRQEALRALAEWRPELTLEELEELRQPRFKADLD